MQRQAEPFAVSPHLPFCRGEGAWTTPTQQRGKPRPGEALGAGPQKVLEVEGQEEELASLMTVKGQQKSEQWVKKTPAMQTG